jgi:hypothetical protein
MLWLLASLGGGASPATSIDHFQKAATVAAPNDRDDHTLTAPE